MQNIKNIIFDLGGVLLNLDIAAAEKAFAEIGFQDFKQLFGKGQVTSFIKDYEVGAIDDDQFVKEIKKVVKAENADDVAIAAWNAMLLDFPAERIEFLHKLQTRYRLFLFSNTNSLHLQSFRKTYSAAFNQAILDDHFEKAYYSHEIKLRKPDKEAFDYVINDSKLNAAETLFIDDTLPNVEGARKAGLQAIHLKPGMSITELELL
jgi:putative hydrolase of the HAD superfamily